MSDAHQLGPVRGKEYKVFLVEVDDDDRERVLSGRVSHVEIKTEPQWTTVRVESEYLPVGRFLESTDTTITMKMIPMDERGNVFILENFLDEEEA